MDRGVPESLPGFRLPGRGWWYERTRDQGQGGEGAGKVG